MKMFYYGMVTFGTSTHKPLWLLCPVSPAQTCWDTLYVLMHIPTIQPHSWHFVKYLSETQFMTCLKQDGAKIKGMWLDSRYIFISFNIKQSHLLLLSFDKKQYLAKELLSKLSCWFCEASWVLSFLLLILLLWMNMCITRIGVRCPYIATLFF